MNKSFAFTVKKFSSRLSKLVIGLISFVILILIIIQIGIVGSIFWFNSEKGQTLIQKQITMATEESGYDVLFKKISYAFPQGISISGLSITDEDGKILDLNRVIMRPGLFGLGVKHLGISIQADELVLYRLPRKAESVETESDAFGLEPFSIPDLYFNSFALNNLSIGKLDIKEEAFGTPLSLSPDLESEITLGDVIEFNLRLTNDALGAPLQSWLPDNISLNGSLDPKSLEMIVSRALLENTNFSMEADGRVVLSEGGDVDLKTKANIKQLKAFAEDFEGQAQAQAAISGTLDQPALMAKGVLSSPQLKERSLEDIRFEFMDDNLLVAPLGRAKIESVYLEKPVSLAANFSIEENILTLDGIEGEAPELTLSGDLKINTNDILGEGTLKLKAGDLKIYSALAGQSIDGSATADILLKPVDQKQGVTIDAVLNSIAYEGMMLREARINAAIDNFQNPWPGTLKADLKDFKPSSDVNFTSAALSISDKGNDQYDASLKASGQAVQNFTVNGKGLIKGIKAQNINADNLNITVRSKGSAIKITGQVDQSVLDVDLTTNNFDLASLPLSIPEQLRDVRLNADAKVTGALDKPVMTLDAKFTPINVAEKTDITISAKGQYQNNLATLNMTGHGSAIQNLNGTAKAPLTLSFMPFVFDIPQNTNLEGQLSANAKADALSPLFLPVGHTMRGDISVDGRLSGTLDNPDMRGTVSFRDGFYRFDAYGVELHDVAMNADLNTDGIVVQNLSARDSRSGTLNGNGRFSFIDTTDANVKISLNDFYLFESDKADGTLSADLNLKGQSEGYLLSGDISLGQFDIVIPERFQSKIPQLNIVEDDDRQKQKEHLRTFSLDMDVIADNKIFVRGWGLDAEFGGKVDVTGTLDDPQINGALSARRGRYEEFGRRFNLDRAYLRFQGSTPPSPYLDIVATTQADEVKASVNLSGEIGDPKIKLSSVPALPEDEVMSHILFGENLQKITPFQAIQLKQTLDRFAGRGGNGFDPLGKLRDLTGFDDLRIDQDDDGNASVGAGKYLSEDVYLELEKGAGEDTGTAKVEVELTPSITLESEVGQNAQAGAGVLWKWDY